MSECNYGVCKEGEGRGGVTAFKWEVWECRTVYAKLLMYTTRLNQDSQ